MGRTEVSRTIHAPIKRVFEAVAHIETFSQVVPHILKVEFLSGTQRGVGARFRETRLTGKREATTEVEVAEYVPNERVRMVPDQGGTIWDTLFTTRQVADGVVELALVMDARAYKVPAKVIHPLIRGMVRRAIEWDLVAVKAYCER